MAPSGHSRCFWVFAVQSYSKCQHRTMTQTYIVYLFNGHNRFLAKLNLVFTQEITFDIEPDLEVSFRPSLGTISKLSPKTSTNFSFVPMDGSFGVNRTYPGFAGLGDISLRVRPAAHQSITLPPVPYLQEYPIYTSFSTATANIGTHVLQLVIL